MKAEINKHNYEEFFIDYLDGNLDDQEIIEMENFLLAHPELREELEGLEKAFISPDNSEYSNKENLKQIDLDLPVSESNFEFYCIAFNEGDLNENEMAAFYKYLHEHPEKEKEKAIFEKLNLKPDRILFTHKKSLKKNVFITYRSQIITTISIAAGIALLFGLFFGLIQKDIQSPSYNLAEGEEKAAVDSTASKEVQKNINEKETLPEKTKRILKKPVIQNAKSNISFKVEIPIAANEIYDTHEGDEIIHEEDKINYAEKFRNIDIDPDEMGNLVAYSPKIQDNIEIRSFSSTYTGLNYSDPGQYLTLEQYAKKKFSGFVFGDENTEFNAVNLASAGINKINQLTGSSMKLESEEVEEGSGKKVAFNSKLISFSTVIAREED